jgi:GH15 family glucan-1,4-alpha-glucosidase
MCADAGWLKVSGLLDWLSENWDQPEEGIWETRGGRQDFTYGRLMSWVAFDRGASAWRQATDDRLPQPAGELHATRSTTRSWTEGGAQT